MARSLLSAPVSYTRDGIVYRARVLSKARQRPAGIDSACFYWRVEKPTRKVIGWLSRDQARDQLIDLARAGVLDPTIGPAAEENYLSSIGEVLDAWIETISGALYRSPKTRRPLRAETLARYRQIAECSDLSTLRSRPIAEWTQTTADEWLLSSMASGMARSTLEQRINVLRQAFGWATREEYVLMPAPALELPGEWITPPRTAQRRPSLEEVLAVLEDLAPYPLVHMACRLMHATGARPGEICALRPDDLERARDGRVYVRLGRHPGARKTGERTLPLPDPLGSEALALAQERQATPLPRRLLVSKAAVWQQLQRSCKRLEIEPFAAKGFRYLKSKVLMDAHVDPARYEAWMGHSFRIGMDWYRQVRPEELGDLAELGRAPAGQVYSFKKQG